MEQHNQEIGTRRDLVLYRLETARNDLKSARALFSIEDYKGANNRAYYSIFHAINAVHAVSGKAYKRHKDAVANFNKDYVKTSVFPREMEGKLDRQKRFAMPAIMMIFILQVKKNQNGRFQLQMNL